MAGDTCEVVACGSCIDSSQQTVAGSHRFVNRGCDVVSGETCCEVVGQLRFSTHFHIVSVHTCFGDNTILMRISEGYGV